MEKKVKYRLKNEIKGNFRVFSFTMFTIDWFSKTKNKNEIKLFFQ
jgi:hypothetical protein